MTGAGPLGPFRAHARGPRDPRRPVPLYGRQPRSPGRSDARFPGSEHRLRSLPAGKPRLDSHPLCRSRRSTPDPPQLSRDRERSQHADRGAPHCPPPFRDRGDASLLLGRDDARPRRPDGRRVARLYTREGRHRIPRERDLPDGIGPDAARRSGASRTRGGRAPRRRCLGDAHRRFRQHQCGDHHDRREGRRHDPSARQTASELVQEALRPLSGRRRLVASRAA